MSKFKVIHYPEGDLHSLLLGASIAWDYRPELRCGLTKREFLETTLENEGEIPLLACFQEETYCGAITFTPPRRDVHHAGTGRSVISMSVVPGRAGAFRELIKTLEGLIRAEGGSWVSTPRRLSPSEVKIEYRSI